MLPFHGVVVMQAMKGLVACGKILFSFPASGKEAAALFIPKAELMDCAAVDRTLRRIAHEIIEQNQQRPAPLLVGIRRRGVPIAERIAAQVEAISGQAMPVGQLDITLYRDDLTEITPEPAVSETVLPFDISGQTVILVDDVIYTGRTVRAAIDAIFAHGRPARVQLAVLVDRGHRELPVRADYVGKNIPTAQDELVAVAIPPYDAETCVRLFAKPTP